MAYTAAAMYGGATLDEVITGSIPGDPPLDLVSVAVAAVVVAALLVFGPRLPRWALACLGPLGVVLIAQAIAGAPVSGDAAVLYLWPVVWTSFFFGRRGAVAIVGFIGAAHGLALLSLAASRGYPGRWVVVMVSASVVAAVVAELSEHGERLLLRLAEEARHDALTGLLNRRGFEERAALELARARRSGEPVALAMFDLDHFKRVNDDWGHQVGDRVLARTGEVIAAHAGEADVVARLGGEEFVVLLADGSETSARTYAERVRDALVRIEEAGLPTVRVSVGIDHGPAALSIKPMQERADSALYEAKRAGRDRTRVFAAG
jgi:diguanylate cyclase (GGDEF)-like protein